jgi:hypothetical protein
VHGPHAGLDAQHYTAQVHLQRAAPTLREIRLWGTSGVVDESAGFPAGVFIHVGDYDGSSILRRPYHDARPVPAPVTSVTFPRIPTIWFYSECLREQQAHAYED